VSAAKRQSGPDLLLITISSFVFRLITIFEVCNDAATRNYYAGDTGASLDEPFAEVANLCCGALNRELACRFRHLAMSIPYRLDASCLAFLDVLNPRFRASYDIEINNSARVRVTLCMCCDTPVEYSPTVQAAHEAGALEMF
jgi:hypothetical protein